MTLVRLCLLLPLLFSSTAFAADHCVDVQAKRGWQQLSLPGGKITGVQYSGGWSVIAGMYKAVGPRGYSGEDARKLGPHLRPKPPDLAPQKICPATLKRRSGSSTTRSIGVSPSSSTPSRTRPSHPGPWRR